MNESASGTVKVRRAEINSKNNNGSSSFSNSNNDSNSGSNSNSDSDSNSNKEHRQIHQQHQVQRKQDSKNDSNRNSYNCTDSNRSNDSDSSSDSNNDSDSSRYFFLICEYRLLTTRRPHALGHSSRQGIDRGGLRLELMEKCHWRFRKSGLLLTVPPQPLSALTVDSGMSARGEVLLVEKIQGKTKSSKCNYTEGFKEKRTSVC
ncbi:hypothetical protein PoB_004837100 [Plakobranchus ocellatus]|uniref:Uncharacterized protein n=1 Tax=Plakobranchus ocellatus TaxID=259542 RepID=A0AAV4BEW4_9GAST|nr:hypothetical protein PoB_004837100 [Plakobranchus ocellatus]